MRASELQVHGPRPSQKRSTTFSAPGRTAGCGFDGWPKLIGGRPWHVFGSIQPIVNDSPGVQVTTGAARVLAPAFPSQPQSRCGPVVGDAQGSSTEWPAGALS